MSSPDPPAPRQEAAQQPPRGEARHGESPAESVLSLTNQGWAALESGEPHEALQLFRRALRLRPEYERARSGVVEALKARHPLYRWVLGSFFWLARFPPSLQIGVMLVAFLALRLISEVVARQAELGVVLWPLMIAILAICIFGGLASPLFDVILRLDPVGQKSLSDDQRRGANLLILHLLLPVPILFWAVATENGLGIVSWILLSMSALPASTIYRCPPGWRRWLLAAVTLVVIGLILPLTGNALFNIPAWDDAQRSQWIPICVYALIAAQLAATALLASGGRH